MISPSRCGSCWQFFFCCLLVILFIHSSSHRLQAGLAPAPGASPGKNEAVKFNSEGEWLVAETTRTIAELLAFAKDPATAPSVTVTGEKGAPDIYHVTVHRGPDATEATLTLKSFVWSPNDYLDWTRQLLSAWKLTPPKPSAASAGLLAALTTPTPAIIQRESKRVSGGLTQAPLDARRQEEAALLYASFALRDAGGAFADIRRELCHLTAHLAIARVLDPAATNNTQQIAEAALETLAGRETPAIKHLDAIDRNAPAEAQSWVRTLRLRNTGDWRNPSAQATLLEQFEIFRARAHSVGAAFAVAYLDQQPLASVHDWRRLILEVPTGVELGHRFAKTGSFEEIRSLQDDWREYFGSGLPPKDIVPALNELPIPAVERAGRGNAKITILGWDFWAAQHRQHLCQAIRECNFFLRDWWSIPDYKNFQQQMQTTFANLTVLPLLEHQLSDRSSDAPAISERVRALIDTHPELITAATWHGLRERGGRLPPLDIPDSVDWFVPALPSGTAYDLSDRVRLLSLHRQSLSWWDDLAALAPSNQEIHYYDLWKRFKEKVPVDAAKQAYEPLLGYHLVAMRALAKVLEKTDPAGYENLMGRICEIQPNAFFELGQWYRDRQQLERAAEADLKGVELAPDRVNVSNRCEWLVLYLEAHGNSDRATAIAQMAGDVYSGGGLITMGKLLEKRGKLVEAESWFQKLVERYDDRRALNRFYFRERTANPACAKAFDTLLRSSHPAGWEKVTLADFTKAPDDGMVVTSTIPKAADYDLHTGDVVVAIEGCHIHSKAEYEFIRELSEEPEIQIIVWNKESYREIKGGAPNRHFGINIGDYPAPN